MHICTGYMYVCMYVCVYTHSPRCIAFYTRVSDAYMYWLYVCMYVCKCICVYVCAYTYIQAQRAEKLVTIIAFKQAMYIYIYIYIYSSKRYIYIYIRHIHIHTHMYRHNTPKSSSLSLPSSKRYYKRSLSTSDL